nr:FAD-dependent monooxygenase [Janthinobacterium sp. AD80]
MKPASIHTPVLIIGGSLVGLSASLFLAWRGVPHILVEKHHGSAAHPRATGFTEHTLEFFRAAGIAERIPQVPPGASVRRARVASLAGQHYEELPWTPGQPEERDGKASPTTGAAIAQDLLEPILREAARARGADLRTGVELLSVQQDAQRVTAQLRQRDTGACYAVTADYLIAADGAASPTREQLGIGRQGAGPLRVLRSVLFRCAEADTFLERGIRQFDIDQPGFQGFLGTYSDGRWFLMFEEQSDSTEEQLRALVRQALGKDMAFELITTGRWELAGLIADRFSEGRIFLAGDSAHQLPPTRGGYGANTGIDDAYNLAWKLQRVLRRQARPALLDTYTDERRPIAWLRHQQTFARPALREMGRRRLPGHALVWQSGDGTGPAHALWRHPRRRRGTAASCPPARLGRPARHARAPRLGPASGQQRLQHRPPDRGFRAADSRSALVRRRRASAAQDPAGRRRRDFPRRAAVPRQLRHRR